MRSAYLAQNRVRIVGAAPAVKRIANNGEKIVEKFGQLLRKYRLRWRDPQDLKTHLTQEEISTQLGYGESTYGQWERGRSQPEHRDDLLCLLRILCQGRALETLEAVNELLRAGSYRDLTPQEIAWVMPAWETEAVPVDEALTLPLSTEEPDAVQQVYEHFPLDLFYQALRKGHEISLLNTWFPNLHTFHEPLLEALQQGARVRILILYPRSFIAELRNEALSLSPGPVLKESVQRGVTDNFEILRYIAAHFESSRRPQLQVRVYHSLPSISIYRVDDLCLTGIYFHGRLAINAPQLQVNMHSFLGKRIEEEFNTLWSIGRPIQELDEWRHELDLLSGRF